MAEAGAVELGLVQIGADDPPPSVPIFVCRHESARPLNLASANTEMGQVLEQLSKL